MKFVKTTIKAAPEFKLWKNGDLVAEFTTKEKMMEASNNQDFEAAKEYRDLIASINHVAGNQKIVTHKFEDRDIIAYAFDEGETVVVVFFVRNGKLIGRENFYMKTGENDGKDILTNFIKQYYIGTPFIPHQVLVQEEIDEPELIAKMLSRNLNYTVQIANPKKGKKENDVERQKKSAYWYSDEDQEERIKKII